MKKCEICKGDRYSSIMGGMREKCKSCDGKGFIPVGATQPQPKKKTEKKSDEQE